MHERYGFLEFVYEVLDFARSMSKSQIFLAGILVSFMCGLGLGFFLWHASSQNEIGVLREVEVTEVSDTVSRYSNDTFGFSLEYPQEFEVREVTEDGGGMTIVFQKPSEQYGFQIFITPHQEEFITEARIRADIPSGKMEHPQEIVIGSQNIRALHFMSEAPVIGNSAEVWFIRNGSLFEVTTYEALDAELATVLSTLTFLK